VECEEAGKMVNDTGPHTKKKKKKQQKPKTEESEEATGAHEESENTEECQIIKKMTAKCPD
jgi:hypothetical protein